MSFPIGCGTENDYNRTKEIGLLDGVKRWVRLYTDQENKVYRVFPAPEGRFDEPQWPPLSEAKIFRLCFRDKGRMIDSTEHELFKKWAARDRDTSLVWFDREGSPRSRKYGSSISNSFPGPASTRTCSACVRMNYAPGGASSSGKISWIRRHPTARTTAHCSSALLRPPNAPAISH